MLSCCLIGEDSLVIQCAEILLNKGHTLFGIITPTPQIRQWAYQHHIPCFKIEDFIKNNFSANQFDYLFSVASGYILGEEILRTAKKMAINYHNSLLPKYAGMYATSWAILNDEKKHGVTWHVVTETLDAGDIVKQVPFGIDKKDTALTLNFKCYEHAIHSFSELLHDIENNTVTYTKQDLSQRSFNSPHKRPPQNGVISWNKPAQDIDKLYRALTLGHYLNKFGIPKVVLGNEVFYLQELEVLRVHSVAHPGTVMLVAENELHVATTTYNVAIRKVTNLDGVAYSLGELAKQYQITAGHQLTLFTQQYLDRIEQIAEKNCQSRGYWVGELARIISGKSPLSIPSRARRQGSLVQSIKIPESLLSTLFALGKGVKAGDPVWLPKDILLAAVMIYLYRLNNCDNFTIRFTLPDVVEQYAEYEQFFSVQLPLTLKFSPQFNFQEALESVLAQVEQLKGRGMYPRDIKLRYPGLSDILDSSLLTVEIASDLANHQPQSSPVSIVIAEDGSGLSVFADSEVLSLYHFGSLLANMAWHVLKLLNAVAQEPALNIARLNLLMTLEQEHILNDWNNTETLYPREKTIHQLFEDQVAKTPNRIAVVSEGDHLTYRELNRKANQLAHFLRRQGVTAETLVPICAERSVEVVVGILAILKAGGAYVPLDPNYPSERLFFMLGNCRATILLVNSASLKQRFTDYQGDIVDLTLLDKELANESTLDLPLLATSDNLAYVIYTSGSTGKPKGVCTTHRSLNNHMYWMLNRYQFSEDDIFLQKTPFSFDASVWEFFAPLLCGARLVMAPEHVHADPVQLIESVNKYQVSILQLVPSLLRAMLEENTFTQCSTLKQVFCGGEALQPETVRFFLQSLPIPLHNLYGPTEATIDTVTCTYRDLNTVTDTIIIGKPINNTKAYILDAHLQLSPIGVTGELYLGGDSLARGYLHQQELTKAKFISNPFSQNAGDRLYQTGDLARWLPDGNIEYIGRTDDQIKVRGVRIELGEIESYITQFKIIRQCALVIHEQIPGSSASVFLVAYLVLKPGSEFNDSQLRGFLNKLLPYYMIPNRFVILDRLPLLPNGKLDRKKLPKLEQYSLWGTWKKYVAPTNFEEQILASIWQSVLEVKHIGVHDNFFDLGGSSLSAIRILKLIQNQFSVKLSIRSVFDSPTIALLANAVRKIRQNLTVVGEASSGSIPSPVITLQSNGFKPPLFLLHQVGGTIFWYKTLSRYLGKSRPMYAIQDPGIDSQNFLFNSIEEMALFYLNAIREVQPRGPYLLAGASFGATLAVEIAKQLQEQGQSIKFIGLLDGWAIYPEKLDNMNFFEQLMREQNQLMGIDDNNFLLKLQWHRKQLLLKYHLPILPNKLTLFRANELWPIFQPIDSPTNGWDQYSTCPVEVHEIPGNHITIMWEPHVQVLAKAMLKSLAELEVPDHKSVSGYRQLAL